MSGHAGKGVIVTAWPRAIILGEKLPRRFMAGFKTTGAGGSPSGTVDIAVIDRKA